MTDPAPSPRFTLGYVAGVTPTKWVRVWHERLADVKLDLLPLDALDAAHVLRSGAADAAFVRLPIATDGEQRISVITLYAETPVVVVPKDHVICAAEEIAVADLAGEIVLHPHDDLLEWERLPGTPAAERPADTAGAIELVATGIGVVVVPQSLARLHSRKDLTYRPVTDAPESPIGLAWLESTTTELVEELIGIVRGRTANSSRGRSASDEPAPKRSASEKAAAKRARMNLPEPRARTGPKRPGKSSGGRKRR